MAPLLSRLGVGGGGFGFGKRKVGSGGPNKPLTIELLMVGGGGGGGSGGGGGGGGGAGALIYKSALPIVSGSLYATVVGPGASGTPNSLTYSCSGNEGTASEFGSGLVPSYLQAPGGGYGASGCAGTGYSNPGGPGGSGVQCAQS